MPSNLTRRQLYELVWDHPVPEVASHLGLPESLLRQICEAHRVPVPKAAFWRDKAAGGRAKRAVFTSTLDAALEVVEFEQTERSAPLVTSSASPITKPKPPKNLPATPRRPGRTEWTIVDNPHPALRLVAKALRTAKPDSHGVVTAAGDNIPGTSVGQPSVERSIFILDVIFRDLERRNIDIATSRQWLTAKRGEESVDFKLSEKVAKVRHSPTSSELQAEARRVRLGGSNHDWFWTKAYPEFDYLLTGNLKLSISIWGSRGRRLDWQDRKTFSLEDQALEIAAEIAERLEADRLHRIEQERQKRIWRRAEENQRLAESRRKREDEREGLIPEFIRLEAKARDLRTWITWAEATDDPETRRMLDWAEARLASIERAVHPAGFGDCLREKKLFPDVDPYAPLPVDPDSS